MLCHMMLNYVPFTVMVTTNRDNIIYICIYIYITKNNKALVTSRGNKEIIKRKDLIKH